MAMVFAAPDGVDGAHELVCAARHAEGVEVLRDAGVGGIGDEFDGAVDRPRADDDDVDGGLGDGFGRRRTGHAEVMLRSYGASVFALGVVRSGAAWRESVSRRRRSIEGCVIPVACTS